MWKTYRIRSCHPEPYSAKDLAAQLGQDSSRSTAQNDNCASRRSAFTLVELLVVIGIIALLIAILLPSLNRARAQAKAIACQTQMRTIGQSMLIYANNNRGYYFPPENGL